MDEKTTRKFLKPLRGNGELLQSDRRVAEVRYYLQGWQDFGAGSLLPNQAAPLAGMDGEITLAPQDCLHLGPEQLIGQDFRLHTEQHADYDVHVYKLKNNDPSRGRYSVHCRLPGRS